MSTIPSWPASLPKEWYDPNTPPDYQGQDNTIRSQVTGPAKIRRRFTATPEDVTLVNTLTEDQLDLLEGFVKDTLFETGKFSWIDHTKTGRYVDYRFKAGWSSVHRVHAGGEMWTVTLTLEQMP